MQQKESSTKFKIGLTRRHKGPKKFKIKTPYAVHGKPGKCRKDQKQAQDLWFKIKKKRFCL